MLSTMPDFQLTIAGVMRHGEAVHGLQRGRDDDGPGRQWRCHPPGVLRRDHAQRGPPGQCGCARSG